MDYEDICTSMIHHSYEEDPFTYLKEEVINNTLLWIRAPIQYQDLNDNDLVQMHYTHKGELVPNHIIIEEYL